MTTVKRNGASSNVATMIVTCKGRLDHLRQTLPAILDQQCSFPYRVVVVDFGCPQETYRWCASLRHSRLSALRVTDNTEEFNRSRARNCGAWHAKGPLLAFVDADMRLESNWLETAGRPVLHGTAVFCQVAAMKDCWDRAGTWVVAADAFHRVRGYDEGFRGWGGEDIDLYRRCHALGRRAKYAPSLITPIRHEHEERVSFHDQKQLDESYQRNMAHLRRRGERVNPDGYGRGEFEFFEMDTSFPPQSSHSETLRQVSHAINIQP